MGSEMCIRDRKNLVKDRVITQKQKDNLKLELEKKISQYKIIER